MKNHRIAFLILLGIVYMQLVPAASNILPTNTSKVREVMLKSRLSGDFPNYSYVDLVNMLKDLERLSVLPDSGEISAECTSRDRSSTYNQSTSQYTNWSANGDGVGFIRMNNDGGKIIAEMTGTGCIWRIWGGSESGSHVKIFLDGSVTPVVDLAWSDYFNHSQSPFNYGTLVYNVRRGLNNSAGGLNNYVPIPYNSSCKVVSYTDLGSFFQIGYSKFPLGTSLPDFSRNLSIPEQNALSNVDNFFLTGLGTDPAGDRPGQVTDSTSYTLTGGQEVIPLDYSGQGAITGIRIRVNGLLSKSEQWSALRELAISIFWDNDIKPAVWAPLGDFFGSACGYTPFKALPVGKLENGWMYCYWYMPFDSKAKMIIKNDGSKSRNFDISITRSSLTKPIASLGRFHAKWNRNAFPVTRIDRKPDYTVLTTTGKGRFLGFMLHVYKPNNNSDPNSAPGDYWWGEGDEKFFVDGEKMPSSFGTGSEDYFGYSWATPDYFSKPFHSQVYNEGGILWKGNRSLNRFQITDNIPFQSSFEGTIEKYYSNTYAQYGVMPYWYLAPGGNDPYGEVSLNERTGYYESPLPRDTTRIEGEDMTVLSQTAGSLVVQDETVFGSGWSNNKHLLWYKNNLSDVVQNSTAVVAFLVKSKDLYSIRAVLSKAGDYGIAKLYVDNKLIGGQIDCYSNSITRTPELTLDTIELSQGTHELKIVMVGKNRSASGYYFGLDYLKLVKVVDMINDIGLPVEIKNFSVYPSPVKNKFTIDAKGMYKLEISDISGKVIITRDMVDTTTSIDMSKFQNGIFILKATNTKGESLVRKLLKN